MSAVLDDAPVFRPMRTPDLTAVLAIERDVHRFPWTWGIFEDCLRVGYSCWVLAAGQDIRAFGIVSAIAGEAHILNLCVQRSWQRKGLGRQTLLHLIDVARVHQCDTVLLEVRPSNTGAVALYQSEGFHEAGTRKAYYPAEKGREDALILARAC